MAKSGKSGKKVSKSVPAVDHAEGKGKKEKKITIKFFLNKAVQPHSINNKRCYPIYVMITYNRKNTMLKSYYGYYYRDLKDVEPGLLAFEEKIVRRMITYERDKEGNKFTLKGLYRKYDRYCVSLYVVLEGRLKMELYHIVGGTKPYEYGLALNIGDRNIRFDTLYAMAKKLYAELSLPDIFKEEIEMFDDYNKLYGIPFFEYNFPTVIEWVDGSAQADYRKKLEVVHKNDTKVIDRNIMLIDNIVQATLR